MVRKASSIMSKPSLNHYLDEYKNNVSSLPGFSLDWLSCLRSKAFDHFSDTGFPSLREEEWRYTNVSAIEKKLFSPQLKSDNPDINQEYLDRYKLDGAVCMVLVNGCFSKELSDLDKLPENATIMSMTDAIEQQPGLLENYLGKAVTHEEHGFVAFNTAWFSDGLLVHVPANQIVEKPIQLIHLVTQADLMVTTRNIFLLYEMAKVEIIETFVGEEDAYLSAAVTEVFVGNNAELTLSKIQNESDRAYHFGGTYVRQSRDSRFKHHNFVFGSLLARNDIHTDLGVAAECDLNGLYLGINRQHIDNHTRINHMKPHSISRELYKGVLNQRARGVFQGRVYVAEDAQKIDSQMNNRNLLLSKEAEADTKPQLEIYADDVKCAHGVTVGQLEEQSIFYLQTRGVDKESARNILTFAFANEMVDKVKLNSLHGLLMGLLLERFPQGSVDKEWL